MSLFKAREFWCTNCEDGEYFDQNSLLTTVLNSESDLIITASQRGVLRIFKPSCEINEKNVFNGFHPNDLLIEKLFDSPILQIECGRLVSGSQNIQLAVLHPRVLSVYSLSIKEGIAEHGNQNCIELLYEHRLFRSAASFLIGPFGGSQNRDFICVQSLDGMFTFFEQESQGFSCFVPDFLLPAPVVFEKRTDCFVTVSSNWTLVSYRYKLLSESCEKSGDKIYSTPKVPPEWSYELGECVIDIKIIEDEINKESCLMILGERNLYCVNEKGKLRFMKRLEFSPICFHVYILNDNVMSLVVSETQTLLIYQNTCLKWSARLNFLPCAIRRAFLRNVEGTIVLLSEEGRLECCYLGTEPSLFVAPPLNSTEIDFQKAEEELNELNRTLKRSYGNDAKISSSLEKELQINATVDQQLQTCVYESNIKTCTNLSMCTVTVNITPHCLLEEVQISMFVQKPLKCVPTSQFYRNINEKTSLTCDVFMDEVLDVPSLTLKIVASVISNLGVPKNVTSEVMLPINLAMDICQAQKDGEHKITLTTNLTPVPLATLFPEYANENAANPLNNAMGFKNVSGAGKSATILLAKSSDRYRLQSDSMASLNLIVEQTIFRLKKHYSGNNNYNVSYSSSLPINELLKYVKEHFDSRYRVAELQNDLVQLSAQFRMIQKRLISKLKVKNPTPLTSLELLLQDTYSDVMELSQNIETQLANLLKAQTELSCVLNLVLQLLKLIGMDSTLLRMVESALCTSVCDLEAQSWEDVFDCSLCYLLRTVLAKSEKDQLRAAHTSFEEIKDLQKLEKHLTQVFDRLCKKGTILTSQNENEEDKDKEDQNEEEDMSTKPVGSQFAESSTRLLSARKSLLRRRMQTDD